MLSGSRLGRYLLTQKLGAGGMAEIWEAFDERLHRNVAVKVILPAISRETEFRERFQREARLAASLEHPHIVPIFDFGYEGEQAFLVTPILRGGSLRDRFVSPVAAPQALRWLAEMAAALDHAHAQGVLHRDVTPANILFDRTGRLFLCDFGLAKHAHGPSELTAAGVVVGTPSYMSPEQASGRQLGPRSDQYALGVIAFRLLTGRLPFTADAPIADLHKTLMEAPPAATSVNPALPPEVDPVFTTVLAKSPEERYATCGEFVDFLSRAVDVTAATAAEAMPSGTLPMPRTPTPTPRTATQATASTLAEASGPMSAAAPPPLSVPRVAPPPLPKTSRGAPPALGIALLVVAGAAAGAYFALRRPAPAPGPGPTPAPVASPLAAPTPEAPPTVSPPTPEAVPLPTEPPIVVISKEPGTPLPVPTRRRANRATATPTEALDAGRQPEPQPPARSEPAPREPAPREAAAREAGALRAETTISVRQGVKINVDPTDARVFLDGRYIGISNDWDGHGGGELLTFEDEGTHRLRFAFPGRRDRVVDLRITRGADKDVKEIEGKLDDGTPGGPTGPEGKLEHPKYQTKGTIRLVTEPPDAELMVDGRSLGPASRYAEQGLALKGPGVHDMVLQAPGYRSKAFRVIVALAAKKDAVVVKERLKRE
jgi:predicted Ser/Thr protein kinase